MENRKDHRPIISNYKGFNFISNVHDQKHLDSLETFEIRETDVFVITYPKSDTGTTWFQYLLSLLYYSNEVEGEDAKMTIEVVPWIEVHMKKQDYCKKPSPRLFVSHLPYNLIPNGLKEKGKVIYVARNPKDVAVSFYHFHNFSNFLENQESFGDFLNKFLHGNVFGSSWFDHIKDWYSHKHEFDFLYITYEEMNKDLRSSVLKISHFLDKKLDEKTIDMIVEKGSFKNMKNNPVANSERLSSEHFDRSKGSFLRKGKVGDWKNLFTVAHNERFDEFYWKAMKDVPLDFIWDPCE
uniref:Sulfotransferase n=1 Tax=Lepisosteus oculatus TaxID=7918 RepID=W5NKK0_LEPOC